VSKIQNQNRKPTWLARVVERVLEPRTDSMSLLSENPELRELMHLILAGHRLQNQRRRQKCVTKVAAIIDVFLVSFSVCLMLYMLKGVCRVSYGPWRQIRSDRQDARGELPVKGTVPEWVTAAPWCTGQ
jgi:hypothetical protein